MSQKIKCLGPYRSSCCNEIRACKITKKIKNITYDTFHYFYTWKCERSLFVCNLITVSNIFYILYFSAVLLHFYVLVLSLSSLQCKDFYILPCARISSLNRLKQKTYQIIKPHINYHTDIKNITLYSNP